MALVLGVVLAATQFENAHLVVLAMGNHGRLHASAGHQGGANLQLSAVTNGKNLVKHDFLADVRSNLFYLDFFASSNTILFATGFYDRVHTTSFSLEYLSTDPFLRNGRLYWQTKFAAKHLARPKPPRGQRLSIMLLLMAAPILTTTSTPSPNPLALIAGDMRVLDQVIAERLDTSVALIGQISRYIIAAGGKRLRPALVLLTAGALGVDSADKYKLAAVVELIHTATLLHDDVVDESTLRRGRATANETFGNPASVLVGDFLHTRSFQMMVEVGSLPILKVLSDATNVIAEGEVMQLINTHDADLTEEGYLHVIRSKTAKLFEASAQIAAQLAQASPEVEAACATYGQALGTAFQIIDDVLDYDGNTQEMGKNLGDDLREGKNTLPLIIAMQRANAEDAALIRQAIEQGSTEQLPAILSIIRATGALDATREAAHQEALRAIDALRTLPGNTHTQAMEQLASQLLLRRT